MKRSYLFCVFFGLMCSVSLRADVIVSNTVADAEEHLQPQGISGADPRGFVDLTSSDLELITEGDGGLDWQAVALQYTNLGIVRGSLINNAFVTFTVDPGEVDLAGNLELTIYGELVPNATALQGTDFNITNRLRTLASVDWNFSTTNPATGAAYVVGETIRTPNLAPVLQELVNQNGWMADSRLTLMIVPDAYLTNPNGANIPLPEIEISSLDFDTPSLSPLTVDFTAVPEPCSVLSVLTVSGVFCWVRRRKR